MPTFLYSGLELTGLNLATGVWTFDAQGSDVFGDANANTFDVSGVTSYVHGQSFDLQGGNDFFLGSALHEVVWGGIGEDTLNGAGGDDVLFGGAGVDSLNGGDGADVIYTGVADGSIDLIDGGIGQDWVYYGGMSLLGLTLNAASSIEIFNAQGSSVFGTKSGNVFDVSGLLNYSNGNSFELLGGADTFVGSEQGELVHGGKGMDTLNGNGGADVLYGGAGIDSISGGGGSDQLYTGVADGSIDVFNGGSAVDTVVYGGMTMDGLMLTNAENVENLNAQGSGVFGTKYGNVFDVSGILSYTFGTTFYLGGGADAFVGSRVAEVVQGGKGGDTLYGNGGADSLHGGEGIDILRGGGGNDQLFTGVADASIDVFDGGSGTDTVVYGGLFLDGLVLDSSSRVENLNAQGSTVFGTGSGNTFDVSGLSNYTNTNVFSTRGGADVFVGSDVGEVVFGGNGNDTLSGNGGADVLFGGEGNDSLNGGGSGDALHGDNGSDILFGNGGGDTLNGQDGRDVIHGGKGNDVLSGGAKADVFVFEDSWGEDIISDFSTNNKEDIDLSAVSQITNFADLLANHLRVNGDDFAEIYVGANSIVLTGVDIADIGVGLAYSQADFIF